MARLASARSVHLLEVPELRISPTSVSSRTSIQQPGLVPWTYRCGLKDWPIGCRTSTGSVVRSNSSERRRAGPPSYTSRAKTERRPCLGPPTQRGFTTGTSSNPARRNDGLAQLEAQPAAPDQTRAPRTDPQELRSRRCCTDSIAGGSSSIGRGTRHWPWNPGLPRPPALCETLDYPTWCDGDGSGARRDDHANRVPPRRDRRPRPSR